MEEKNILQVSLYLSIERCITTGFKVSIWLIHNYEKNKESYDQPRQHIKKQRHYFVNKGSSSQGYGFSSSHVWMWELNYKESWAPKNWCFWTVVLEKTLDSSLDCKEIQPVHPKGNQSWIFIGRTDAETETQYFGHLMQRTDSSEKGMTEDEMVGWHHQLNGQEFE